MLVEKGEGLDIALDLAIEAVKNKDWEVRKQGVALFYALVEKNKGLSEASKAGKRLTTDPYVKAYLEKLLTLIKRESSGE